MAENCSNGVFLDRGSIGGSDIDLSPLTDTLPGWRFYDATLMAHVADRIRDANVVITNKVVLEGVALEQARKLRLICVAATGTNNVDLDAAARLGIAVCNVRGYATASVSQHVFALLLALITRLPEYHEAVRAGRWQTSEHFCLLDYPIVELAGRVMGIIGYGELGRSVARLAEAFNMDVMIAARPGTVAGTGRVPLDKLLRSADVVSLHCPLTPQTRNLIGARELGLMKSSSILINTARGGIVDESALADALTRGVIAAAGIDVLSVEPPAAGNLLLARSIPRLLVTPHIAWASREARQRMLDEVALNIRAFLSGVPRNLIGAGGQLLG